MAEAPCDPVLLCAPMVCHLQMEEGVTKGYTGVAHLGRIGKMAGFREGALIWVVVLMCDSRISFPSLKHKNNMHHSSENYKKKKVCIICSSDVHYS